MSRTPYEIRSEAEITSIHEDLTILKEDLVELIELRDFVSKGTDDIDDGIAKTIKEIQKIEDELKTKVSEMKKYDGSGDSSAKVT